MNKITRKYCSIFADNQNRKYDSEFKVVPKKINEHKRERHLWFDKTKKKKLGKAKYGNSSSNNIDN